MEDKRIELHAQLIWDKRIAERSMYCTSSGKKIVIGDTYYERIADITMYDIKMEQSMGMILTEKEYFKHILKGNIDNE